MTEYLALPYICSIDGRCVLRDAFTDTLLVGHLDGVFSKPGHGLRHATDIESVIKTQRSRLRGLSQPLSPVWGESKLVWTKDNGSGFTRVSGRTLVALILPEDGMADIAFGWDIVINTTDPRTIGHGVLLGENQGSIYAIVPGLKIWLDYGSRAIQYLIGVTLNDIGAVYWISTFSSDSGIFMQDPRGIPAYPTARILWVDYAATTTPLYPYVSGYDNVVALNNGHSIEDVRVFDISVWNSADGMAIAADRFTRTDSPTLLGGNWLIDAGTWGISSNKAYLASASGVSRAYLANALVAGDGILSFDFTAPNPITINSGFIIRRQDANNYILGAFNNSILYIQVILAGVYHDSIATLATVAMVAGTTYRIDIHMKGNKYLFFVNGVALNGGTWSTDVGNHLLTETGVGLYGNNSAGYNTARWDNFAVYPNTFTVPEEIDSGKVPDVLIGAATLSSDIFTDANGTRLNVHTPTTGGAWSDLLGTWTINANRCTCSTPAIGSNYVVQDIGVADAECSVDILTPGTLSTYFAGIVGRCVDVNNMVLIRVFMNPSQSGNDEIELIENIAGVGSVVHKAYLGDYFSINSTYTLKLQFKNDLIQVFLDGKPRISYYTTQMSSSGTKFGLYRENTDDGCVFDNWMVKAL